MTPRRPALAILGAATIAATWTIASSDAPPATAGGPHGAALGATTRTPTAEEIDAYGLGPVKVRVHGRIVVALEKAGPAEKAGILVGDALVALDRNDLFSEDDVSDFLLVAREGRHAAAHVRRKGEPAERVVDVTLSASSLEIPKGRIAWQFAGLGQYEEAIAAAKKEGKRVLVGLSGADT